MDVTSEIWRRRLNGTIDITRLPRNSADILERRGLIRDRFRYLWRPPYQISRLPNWYHLALDCYLRPDGTRRFSPIDATALRSDLGLELKCVMHPADLTLTASIGGHRLLEDRGEVGADNLLSFDAARIFCRYIRYRREYLGATTKIDETLAAILSVRPNRTNQHTSLSDLGIVDRDDGKWDRARFMSEGRQAAIDVGITDPTPKEIRRYGLINAARSNPIEISDEESRSITRLTLFAIGETTEKLSMEQLRYVADHVQRSMMYHIDDSDEDFEKWIVDPSGELAHAISKRRDCELSRTQVRQALLELGWLAMQMLSKCADTQMRAFRDALLKPLNETENFFYSQLFLANPAFGGLTLLLLNERFDFLKDVILGIWNNPGDPGSIAVARTLMHYYAVLINGQRMTGRLHKRQALGKIGNGPTPCEQQREVESVCYDKRDLHDQFRKAARLLTEAQGIDCPFGEHDWHAELLNPGESTIRFRIWCPATAFDRVSEVSIAEFKRAADHFEL